MRAFNDRESWTSARGSRDDSYDTIRYAMAHLRQTCNVSTAYALTAESLLKVIGSQRVRTQDTCFAARPHRPAIITTFTFIHTSETRQNATQIGRVSPPLQSEEMPVLKLLDWRSLVPADLNLSSIALYTSCLMSVMRNDWWDARAKGDSGSGHIATTSPVAKGELQRTFWWAAYLLLATWPPTCSRSIAHELLEVWKGP